jgi:hypothetical protein
MATESSEPKPDYSKPLTTDGPNIGSSIAGATADAGSAIAHPLSKGGVFNSLWKTATGKNAYETEKLETAQKNLQSDQIAKQFAMPNLEPGFSQTHIAGDATLHVDGDIRLLFKQRRLETTLGMADITHADQRTTSIGVREIHLVYGAQEVFVNGESSAQYTGKRDTKAPESFEWKQLDRAFAATKFDGALVSTGITGALFEFTGLDCSLKGKEVFSKDISEMLEKEFPEAEEAVEGAGEAAVGEGAAVVAEGTAVAVEGAEVAAVAVEGAEAVAIGAAAIVAAPELLVGAAVIGAFGLAAWGITKAFGSSSNSSAAPTSNSDAGS